ncbi:MAG TPA: hypothetical protein VGY56_02400 [Verrucomicrobiae bacterium]|nr:hypothetical protein [Verrucomicrobiae bacterium]
MNKITARDIQVFVAGALGMWGFGLLSVIPSMIANIWDMGSIGPAVCVVRALVGGLALWLGGTIFFGRMQAVRLTQNLLRLCLILNCCGLVFTLVRVYLASKKPEFVGILIANIIGSAALFWLISLSRSPRFQVMPASTDKSTSQ